MTEPMNDSITGLTLKLIGEDGNAFSILGRARAVLRKANRLDEWDTFHEQATSADYNHLLVVCGEWFDVQ